MLKLVTISRISREKGFNRMLQIEKILNQSGVEFIWDCYGDKNTNHAKEIVPKFKHISFKGVTTEPLKVIKEYDYLVQLSDTEGFPYSIYEAMQQKMPVIATDFPSIHEMIEEGKNGYIIKKDLSNFDINKIINIPVITSFQEKSTEKDWIKFLDMARPKKNTTAPKASTSEKVLSPNDAFTDTRGFGPVEQDDRHWHKYQNVTVEVTRDYHDLQQKSKLIKVGTKFKVGTDRAKELVDAQVAKVVGE